MEGKIKSFTEMKAKRIYINQTTIAKYAKDTTLRRGEKFVRERGTQLRKE